MSTALTTRPDFTPVIDLVVRSCRAKTTRARYARHLAKFCHYWDTHRRPPFTRALVLEYVRSMDGEPAFEICHALTALRALAREARYAGLIDGDTAAGIAEVKGPTVRGTRQGKRLSAEEMAEMLAKPDTSTLEGLRDRVALDLLFYSGLRREEACSITVEHVALIEGRPALVNLMGKGDRIRTVPIPREMHERINEWLAKSGIKSGYLLRRVHRTKDGCRVRGDGPMDGSSLYDIVRAYWDLTPHDLRRTMGALARKAGAEVDEIQAIYGHASATMTQRYIGNVLNFQKAPCDYL